MRMIIVKNGMRMLKKHPIQSLIMLVLTFVCLYMVGVAIDASNKSKAAEIKYEETYGHKTLYYTSEALSDQIFYSYCEEKGREILNESVSDNEIFFCHSFKTVCAGYKFRGTGPISGRL